MKFRMIASEEYSIRIEFHEHRNQWLMHGHCKNGLIFGILVDSSRMETIRLFQITFIYTLLIKEWKN